jgi:hypothetical protein
MPVSFIQNASIAAGAGISTSKLGAGAVLQVVSTTTISAITTTSTSFVTTGFSQSITPSSSSSKILVLLNGGGAYMGTVSNVSMHTTIYRGASNIGDATYGFSRHSTVGGSFMISPHSIAYLDSPSTTSSTTYTVYFRSSSAGNTVDFSNSDRGTVVLTLMEIAA